MGGHGGLNILPQKKWNVYNWDNREIVEKDKKEHAANKRREFEQEREDALDRKMQVLRADSGMPLQTETEAKEDKVHSLISNEMRRLAEQNQHINLFEQEERMLLNKEVAEAKRQKEEEFFREKNVDYSTRFLGAYADESKQPWYAKKKGEKVNEKKNRHFKPLDEVIYGIKTESSVTREVVAASKREEERAVKHEERDRTRQKKYRRYEEQEEKVLRMDRVESHLQKQLQKHEEDLMVKEFKEDKQKEIDKMREKRLRREEKERRRAEELKAKLITQK